MSKRIIVFTLCIAVTFSICTAIIVACTCTSGLIYKNVYDSEFHIPYCETHNFGFAAEPHTFVWKSNSINHWQYCSDCTYATSKTFHTYASNMSITIDTHTKICTACNYRSVESHEISTWAITPMAHRGTCTVCGYTVNEEHTFISGSCRKCGVSENTVINMIEQGIEEMTITAPTVTE